MTAPQYKLVMDRVVTVIKSVPGTGLVYPELKYAQEEKEFITWWVDPNTKGKDNKPQVRSFMCTSPSAPTKRGAARGMILTDMAIRILAYASVVQAEDSETTFGLLTEAVADKLTEAIKLNDSSETTQIRDATPASINNRTYARFGKFLCHYAEITMNVTLQKSVNYQ